MPDQVTLEQVEEMAIQLPCQEQQQLISRLNARLNGQTTSAVQEQADSEYRERLRAFLKLVEDDPAEALVETDSAETIRQIREERASRL